MEELRRRMASAKAWGVEGVSLVTPAEIKELVPFIDESVIVGGFYTEGVGVVDSLRAGTLMREEAQASGALTVVPNVEVTGIDVEGGRVRRVRTTDGDVEADDGRDRLRRLEPAAGARWPAPSIPLTPAIHQMIDIGPVPRFAGAKLGIEFPIVRDMDTNMYERQDGTGLEIGSYAHRPILHDPTRDPLDRGSGAVADRVPVHRGRLRAADGAGARADAGDRRRRERRHQVRDQRAALAHARLAAAARRDARGQGAVVGRRRVGEGGAGRRPRGRRVDDARRVGDRPAVAPTSRASTTARRRRPTCGRAPPRASTRPTGSSTLPSSGLRTATCGCPRSTPASRRSARSSTRPPAGSARTGTSPTPGSSRSTASTAGRPSGTRAGGRRSSTPSTSRCATAPAIFDLSAFCIFDVAGPGALETVQQVAMRQMDVPVGRVVYTPLLTPGGGFRSDLTIMRLGDERFRFVTGGLHGMADLKWVARPRAGRHHGHRPHVGVDDARPVGPARARHPRRA